MLAEAAIREQKALERSNVCVCVLCRETHQVLDGHGLSLERGYLENPLRNGDAARCFHGLFMQRHFSARIHSLPKLLVPAEHPPTKTKVLYYEKAFEMMLESI